MRRLLGAARSVTLHGQVLADPLEHARRPQVGKLGLQELIAIIHGHCSNKKRSSTYSNIMGVLKTTVAVTAASRTLRSSCCFYGNFGNTCASSRQLRIARMSTMGFKRGAHSTDLTKNMKYISQDKLQLRADPATMKLDKKIAKPLCILMSWMMAQPQHVMKYTDIYLEQGFDVLVVSCTPWQLMWPVTGAQVVAGDLLRFMANNDSFAALVVHSFSVGAYLWGELTVHVSKNKPLYQPVLERVNAQVLDSTVDVSELTVGVPAAVFPSNKILQKALQAYLTGHLKVFYESATVHYERASDAFYRLPSSAPALFLLSESDPISAVRVVRGAADTWETLGVKVTWKCWDRSPHVQHFTKHPEEYLAALYAHLDAAGLVSQPDKMPKRL